MRYILFFLFCFFSIVSFAENRQAADSLLNLTTNTADPAQKVRLYRNLADLYQGTPQMKTYLLAMYEEAEKGGDKEGMIDALDDIILNEARSYERDSISKYVELIKKIAPPEKAKSLASFYYMRFFDTLCYQNKKEEAIEEELAFLNTAKETNEDIYRNIASAYITGTGFYMNEQVAMSVPYLEKAVEMTESLPGKDKFRYRKFILWRLCYAYTQTDETLKAIRLMDQLIRQIEQEYQTEYKKQRPFINQEVVMLQYYTFMMGNTKFLSVDQESYYWKKIQALDKFLTDPVDRYNFFLCCNNYYTWNHEKPDYKKSIEANDSLILYAKTLAPNNLPAIYEVNSSLYEKSGDYPNALRYIKEAYKAKDSLSSESFKQQLSELQVKYDLDTLNDTNIQLEIRNKQILLSLLSVILVITITVCVILTLMLRREKRMKLQLQQLHLKAQESENMKQLFINSICHEIRTPLNAIVGFSGLIMNPDIEEDARQRFPEEINKNTLLLTSLVNSMLEMANLDVSEERLPCELTDVKPLFVHQMAQIKLSAKPNIRYVVEQPDVPIVVSSNKRYLSLVIEHLLANANKFTEEGEIRIDCRRDETRGVLEISVADTGCGIPKDKYDAVFERFVKLNEFATGNGLGLYLCRQIVKRLGGTICIDGTHQPGTRIVVTIPVA